MVKTEFGQLLQELRSQAQLNQFKLAELSDLSVGYISLLERGQRNPTRTTIAKLVRGLGSLGLENEERLLVAAGRGLSDAFMSNPVVAHLAFSLNDPSLSEAEKKNLALDVQTDIDASQALHQADLARRQRRWKEADRICQDSLAKIATAMYRRQYPFLRVRATGAFHLGRSKTAHFFREQCLNLAILTKDPSQYIQTSMDIGDDLRAEGQWSAAVQQYELVKKLAEERGRENEYLTFKAMALRKISDVYLIQDIQEPVEAWLTTSLRILQDIENTYEIHKTYYSLGWLYNIRGEYNTAIDYRNKGLTVAREIEDQYNVMKGYLYLGDDYLGLGRPLEALEQYKQALDLSEKISERRSRGTIYLGLGNAHFVLHRLDEALENYKHSLEEHYSSHTDYDVASSLIALGRFHSSMASVESEAQEAEYCFRQAAERFQKTRTIRQLIDAHLGLSNLFFMRENFVKARDYAQKAKELAEKEVYVPHKRLAQAYELVALCLTQGEQDFDEEELVSLWRDLCDNSYKYEPYYLADSCHVILGQIKDVLRVRGSRQASKLSKRLYEILVNNQQFLQAMEKSSIFSEIVEFTKLVNKSRKVK